MTTYKVGYLIGSLAKASINRKLATALVRLAPAELDMAEIPFKDLPLYSYDYDADFPPAARAFKDAIASVDAVLFVTPEYNRSIPGGLKNAIDWASRPYGSNSFARKPSAVIGTSPGAIGTAVAQQSLRSVLGFCNSPQMNAIEAYIQFTPGLISDDGKVTVESTEEFLRGFMAEFHAFIVSWTLALSGRIKRRRTSARPGAAGEASVFRRFVRVPAKSDNRPATGSGSPPPLPRGSAGRQRGSPKTSGPASCTRPRRAPRASRSVAASSAAHKVTSENRPSSSGVVRWIARSDHWRWVSNPRWRRLSWKVTSTAQRIAYHVRICAADCCGSEQTKTRVSARPAGSLVSTQRTGNGLAVRAPQRRSGRDVDVGRIVGRPSPAIPGWSCAPTWWPSGPPASSASADGCRQHAACLSVPSCAVAVG